MVVMLITAKMSICIALIACGILKVKWLMLEQEWGWQIYE